ncbi:hypothetical protein K469DRAFT_691640 [Zopfia rhizophila CBS 207.26]|uniref:Uncharacterized protein n=1 Tax=Zopfia rhizophila CBS 207.26 TaxID=1314779 RepID=A0A6A6DSI4_9PEZI|nr:hypothetical protein K469DRAFT_691640 [Zopfia rhizophila CBS 207.26]
MPSVPTAYLEFLVSCRSANNRDVVATPGGCQPRRRESRVILLHSIGQKGRMDMNILPTFTNMQCTRKLKPQSMVVLRLLAPSGLTCGIFLIFDATHAPRTHDTSIVVDQPASPAQPVGLIFRKGLFRSARIRALAPSTGSGMVGAHPAKLLGKSDRIMFGNTSDVGLQQ